MSKRLSQNEKPASKIVDMPGLLTRVPVGRSTIYRWIAQKRFPKPRSFGPRRVGWTEHEVTDWINKQMNS